MKERKLIMVGGKVYDRVKMVATEGSMLTLVGRIVYDLDTDQFSFEDALAFVGGGFEEC